jgi:N-methylhydantoinase A
VLLALGSRFVISRSAYMRHSGQGYDVRVALPGGPVDAAYEGKMRAAFYETYRREYGFVDPDAAVEATDWYVMASLANERAGASIGAEPATGGSGTANVGERGAYFPECDGMVGAGVIDRYRMKADDGFEGPCLVEERESTTVVLPGDIVKVDRHGHLVIEINSGRRNVR